MVNITGKTLLGATPADGDKFYLVDVSDTTDNANGSDKSIVYTDLLAAALLKAGGTMTGDIAMGGNNITGGGIIKLTEQAAADADTAGDGQLWVKTATPNQLWFTDDAGTDTQLAVAQTVEGTAVLSTGEVGGSKFLREDGDGTSSWQAIGGGGDLLAANNLSDVAVAATAYANIKQAASATATGAVELATIAEVDTGTDPARAITPAGLAGSALQTKVDTIEASADVTDATNVTAAGALMDSEVTNLAQVKAFDTTDYATAAQGATADTAVQPASTDTLTNKTIDANGTGNSISNIDVADLANGTDGELITWDATGAPATVPVGTAAQVLTSNGAGAAPTFQAAGGGGFEGYWMHGYSSNEDMTGRNQHYTSGTGADLVYSVGKHIWGSGTDSAGYSSTALHLADGDATGDDIWDRDMRITMRLGVDFNGSGICEMVSIMGGDGSRTYTTNKYVGIRVEQDSGSTRTVYAISSDGTTEEKTDISANWTWFTSGNNQHRLSVEFNAGVSAVFKVDGTTRATHTTNIPAGAGSSTNYFGEQWVKNGGSTSDNTLSTSVMQAFIAD